MKFHIWDTRSFVGNAVLWWGPNSSGYTTHLDQAGEYEEEEARRIERLRGTDRAVPVEIARACATMQVNADRLRDALGKDPGVSAGHDEEKQA